MIEISYLVSAAFVSSYARKAGVGQELARSTHVDGMALGLGFGHWQ